jgi:hypothetical protein
MKTIFLLLTALFFSTPAFSQEKYQYQGQLYLKNGYRYLAQTDFDDNPLPADKDLPKINVIECINRRCNIDGYLFLKNGKNFIGQTDFDDNRLRYYREY